MLTIKEVIKTFYNALLQRLKKHRGNWEQNDPTADDYIKNRPFYTDETKKETVVKTTNFTATSSPWWGSPFAFIPVVGETYKVTWDGEEYICKGYLAWGECKAIGNIALDGDGQDTGEPFLYWWYNSYDYGMCVRYAGKHTITVEKLEIIKIDKRYLPDNNNVEVEAAIDNLYDYAEYLEDYMWQIPQDTVRYNNSQNLSASQKQTARTNIGAVATSDLATVATSGDYNDLENRPCYLDIDTAPFRNITNRAVSNFSVSYQNSNAYYGQITSTSSTKYFTVGNTYRVIYNGTEYDIVHSGSDSFLGNAHFYSTEYEDTGEPFLIFVYPGGASLYQTNTSRATITVYELTKNIKQLSEELIPDTIARVSELPQSDWSVHDASNLAHVKNRIAYEDAIDTLAYAQYSSSVVTSPDPIHECLAATSLTDDGYYFSQRRLSLSLILDFAKIYAIDGQEYYRDSLSFVPSYSSSPKPYHEAYGYGNLSLIPEEWLEQQFTGSELLVDYDKTDNGAPFALIKDVYTDVSGTIYVYYYLFSKEEGYQLPEVYERTYVLKQLDEKFIPSTIARTEDIPIVVQPDWNQNDPAAADYVKNRTHWVESGLAEIIPETELVWNDNDEWFYIPSPYIEPLAIGVTYIVTLNGETHKCIAFKEEFTKEGVVSISNPDVPFLIQIPSEPYAENIEGTPLSYGSVDMYPNNPDSLTISIKKETETVHTLDPKFLPAGLATETYVDTKVTDLVNTAPEALDTLNELAAALGDDPNFATTVLNQLGNKVDKEEGKGLSTNDFTTEEKTKLSYAAVIYTRETEPVDAAIGSFWLDISED